MIRTPNEEDLSGLAAIEAACFSLPWSEGAIASHLRSDTALTLAAYDGGTPVGVIFLSCLPPEGEVLRLSVLPWARHRGLGEALLEEGVALLKSRGACVLYLDVRASNTPAQSLYRKHGFIEVGRRPGYYRCPKEDALLMKRELV